MNDTALNRIITLPKKGLADGTTRPFQIKIQGKIFEGFVVRKGDKYFAYQNLCRHLPITLDLKDNNFFTHDRKFLQCHMHGAMYEVETGLCVAGPCEGARLQSLLVLEEAEHVVVTVPANLPET